jgi:hypothetical protein
MILLNDDTASPALASGADLGSGRPIVDFDLDDCEETVRLECFSSERLVLVSGEESLASSATSPGRAETPGFAYFLALLDHIHRSADANIYVNASR